MEREFVDIGGVPNEESCAQVGRTKNCEDLNRLECRAYIEALKRRYGEPPGSCVFSIKGNAHEFGRYFEVRMGYDPSRPDATAYAVQVENGLDRWEEAGMKAPVLYSNNGQPFAIRREPDEWLLVTEAEAEAAQ